MNRHIFLKTYLLGLIIVINIHAIDISQRLSCDISQLVGKDDEIKFQDSGDLLVSSGGKFEFPMGLKIIDQKSLVIKQEALIEKKMFIKDFCFLPERNLVGFAVHGSNAKDDLVKFFNARTGQEIKTLALGWAYKFRGRTSDGSRLLVSTSDTCEINFIDLDSLEFREKIDIKSGTLRVAHCPKKQLIASGFDRGSISLLKGYKKENLVKINIPKFKKWKLISKLALSPEGNYLAAVVELTHLIVWNIRNFPDRDPKIVYSESSKFHRFNLKFIDDNNIFYGDRSLLSLETFISREDDRLAGLYYSSNGKGLLAFRRFGGKDTWKLVNIQQLLSQEKIEALND